MNTLQRIETCISMRQWMHDKLSTAIPKAAGLSESTLCDSIIQYIENNTELYPSGWYDPPPHGVSVLMGQNGGVTRLQYDSLRKKEFWPRIDVRVDRNTVGLVYASPVHKVSGTIGDYGFTFYTGGEEHIRTHILNCLSVMRRAAEYAQTGMKLQDLYTHAQLKFSEKKLTNERTVTFTDPVGTNLGHTIPWSYEDPTDEEQGIIRSNDINRLKELISTKRIHVNARETFTIPDTIAFTFEARLESKNDPSLPLVYFHLVVTFKNGIREIHTGFEDLLFPALL